METDIQETLKIHIRRWRSKRFTTAFHTDAGFKLRKLLVKFEEHKLGNINLTESEHNEGLGAISHGDKTVYGTPLNLTFTDTDRVIEAIKNTVRGIHITYLLKFNGLLIVEYLLE